MLTRRKQFSAENAPVERIRSRILAPFVLFVVFLLSGVLTGTYWLQQRSIETHSAELKQHVWVAYAENLSEAASLLRSLSQFVANNRLIQQAWTAQDRQALLEASQPAFKRISEQGHATHLYFHTPEEINFLRVHSPEQYGDPIRRHTLQEAVAKQETAWGVELGLYGHFVLRVVKPWYIEEQLVGYIELGSSIEHLIQRIKRTTGADLVLVIDKQYLDFDAWAEWQGQSASRLIWDQFPDKLVIDKTLSALPKRLVELIGDGVDENDSITIRAGDRVYDTSVLPAIDARNQMLGNVWILVDVTTPHNDLKVLAAVFLSSSILLAGLVVFLFYAYLSSIQSKLSKAYANLRHEISERRQVQHQLESYSYTIAHDLRAPLRSITSFSQILAEEVGETLRGDAKDALQRVMRASRHMAELIDDILELSRITRKQMSFETVDLSRCARVYLERLQSEDPQRKLVYQIEDDVVVNGSKELLSAAIENLLENAWKFTSRKERADIRFGTTRIDGQTVYCVGDNGVGFDMEYVEKLFGTFQRLHAQEDYPGTGIGLATVKRVIERHKGRVWAESQAGEGARFYFTLPDGSA